MLKISRSVFAAAAASLFVFSTPVCKGEPAATAVASALPQSMTATATIQFGGSSSLHDFHGSVQTESFPLNSTGAAGKQKWSADIKVGAHQMSTQNSTRDKDMWKMLGADQFPQIEGTFKDVATPGVGSSIPLNLKIRDMRTEVPLKITEWHADENGVNVTARGEVSLSAYGLTAPSVLGMMKVKDVIWITVNVKAQAGKQNAIKVAVR